MNKFIGEKKVGARTRAKKKPVAVVVKPELPAPAENVEVIKKGQQEFVKCPKCGWVHAYGTKRCRFCGTRL